MMAQDSKRAKRNFPRTGLALALIAVAMLFVAVYIIPDSFMMGMTLLGLAVACLITDAAINESDSEIEKRW